MTLYEMIIISRCGTPSATANFMRIISQRILELGGNIRGARVLGDRIMNKQLIGKDYGRHMIGRYVSITYDGTPEFYKELKKASESSFETLRTHNFRLRDFIKDATDFKKELHEEAPFVKN